MLSCVTATGVERHRRHQSQINVPDVLERLEPLLTARILRVVQGVRDATLHINDGKPVGTSLSYERILALGQHFQRVAFAGLADRVAG